MTARIFPVDAVGGLPLNTGRALRQTSVAPFIALGSTARPLGGVSGVRPGTPSTIGSVTSTQWTVNPVAGTLDGEALAIAGPYTYAFDTAQTGAMSPATSTARTDRLDVQINDSAESDGTPTTTPAYATIVYTVGTTTTPPAAPPRSHPLYLINVPATGGGSPTLTWNATFTAAAGAPVQWPTYQALSGWLTAPLYQVAQVIADPIGANNITYSWNGTTWAPLSAGLNIVAPTNVTGGTVTPTGTVTYNAVTSVELDGVFTSAFDDYLVIIDNTGKSAATNIAFQLCAGGALAPSTAYAAVRGFETGSTRTVGTTAAGALAAIEVEAGQQAVTHIEVSVFGPAKPLATAVDARASSFPFRADVSGTHSTAAAYDGLRLSPNPNGTITGTVTVYGFRK